MIYSRNKFNLLEAKASLGKNGTLALMEANPKKCARFPKSCFIGGAKCRRQANN
jgi:hypothetical protein